MVKSDTVLIGVFEFADTTDEREGCFDSIFLFGTAKERVEIGKCAQGLQLIKKGGENGANTI